MLSSLLPSLRHVLDVDVCADCRVSGSVKPAAKTTSLPGCLLLTDPQTSQTCNTSVLGQSQGGAEKSLQLTSWIKLSVTFWVWILCGSGFHTYNVIARQRDIERTLTNLNSNLKSFQFYLIHTFHRKPVLWRPHTLSNGAA